MAQKMLTCTCGNTELEKIGVRLHLSQNGNGKSLPLVALMCRGSGCGRVTFRPDDNGAAVIVQEEPHSESRSESLPEPRPESRPEPHGPKRIAALFERVYTERLVYKAIAERDPNCSQLFAALKVNPEICASIAEAFAKVNQRLDANEDLLSVLESLPSLNK
jgi:hypothetical protein